MPRKVTETAKLRRHPPIRLSLMASVMLNPSPPGETDDERTKSLYSRGRKRTTDGRRQTGLIGKHSIGGDKIGLMGIY